MQSSPFLNICLGAAILMLSFGGMIWLASSVLIAFMGH